MKKYALLLFIFLPLLVFAQATEVFQHGKWKLEYDKTTGDVNYYYQDMLVYPQVNVAAYAHTKITGRTYSECTISTSSLNDGYGAGKKFTIVRSKAGEVTLTQNFYLYDNKDYFLTDIELSHNQEIATNYICPISTTKGAESHILQKGDSRVLIVPFDNDKWGRYRSADLRGGVNSYEVTAVYNAVKRNGIVIGSVEHDTWKSGIRIESEAPNTISRIEFYTGASGEGTRDVLPHGKVKGLKVRSPKVLFGYFSDWRDGLEEFAQATAVASPLLKWDQGTPFGWNSWAKMEFRMTYDKVIEVSDFYKKHLQNNHFENDEIVYIGMDAGWTNLTEQQLADVVKHCKANGQKAGIYFTPFSDWGKNPEAPIEGSDYKCKDAYLYAHGKTQNIVAGGLAMDPTHPAIQQRIKYWADKFKGWGYEYLKIDFLTHGCAEADSYYDKNVTTGMQAYNIGMKYLMEQMDGMFITMAISPLFPSQYVHSRRIACDAWAGIGDTEYTMNALSYGWWLNGLYTFNDPDHLLLEAVTEGENRARITSGVITGIMMDGDDLSNISGLDEAKKKAKKFLTNPQINAIAKIGKSFRPVNGNMDTGDAVFMHNTGKELYVVAFNYTGYDLVYDIAFSRLDLNPAQRYKCQELWTGEKSEISQKIFFKIPKKDVRVYKIQLH